VIGRGAVVWVTGLPASGKSTLARRILALLLAEGRPAALLDGDAVRSALVPPPGYDAAGRAAFYETIGNLALALAGDGLVAVVAATAHRRSFRDRVRERAPRFVEVFVDVPAETCAARDPKGLWARARAGSAPDLPGASSIAYERPLAPEVVARGGEDAAAADAAVAALDATRATSPRSGTARGGRDT
jgi:adenylylsulfate kinase